MSRILEVTEYIAANILHSKVWDEADEVTRIKALNNAENNLIKFLPYIYKDIVPADELSEQVLWMLKVDDTFQRAELGATYIAVDGVTINIVDRDRSIAPYIIASHNLSTFKGFRRKIGRYSLDIKDTFRMGR